MKVLLKSLLTAAVITSQFAPAGLLAPAQAASSIRLLPPATPLPVDDLSFHLSQYQAASPSAVRWLLPAAQISFEPNAEDWQSAVIRYDTQIITLRRERQPERLAESKQATRQLLLELDNNKNLQVTRDLELKNLLLKQVISVHTLDPDDPYWSNVISGLAQLWHAPVIYRQEVLDDRLRVILAADKDSDPENSIPYLPAALARRQRNENMLLQRKIPILKNLPPVPAEEELELRPARQTLKRALVLLALASTSTTMNRREAANLIYFWGLRHELTPSERDYLTSSELTNAEREKMNWRFESAYILLWSLGIVDAAPYPSKISDIPGLISRIKNKSFEQWMSEVKYRNPSEILDRLDLAFRLNWALAKQQERQWKAYTDLVPEVVPEWLHALDWMSSPQQKWDDALKQLEAQG